MVVEVDSLPRYYQEGRNRHEIDPGYTKREEDHLGLDLQILTTCPPDTGRAPSAAQLVCPCKLGSVRPLRAIGQCCVGHNNPKGT